MPNPDQIFLKQQIEEYLEKLFYDHPSEEFLVALARALHHELMEPNPFRVKRQAMPYRKPLQTLMDAVIAILDSEENVPDGIHGDYVSKKLREAVKSLAEILDKGVLSFRNAERGYETPLTLLN